MNGKNLLDSQEHKRVFDEDILPEHRLDSKTSFENPKAVILAGQPGAGKGGLATVAKDELQGDAVTVDPDALRDHHPNINEFRRTHPYTWSSDTHPDASAWADELREASIAGRKNLIFDTTLSNGDWMSDEIRKMQAKGYDVEVRVLAAYWLQSELGVDGRFTGKVDAEGSGRYVPFGARQAIYDKVPTGLDTVHARTGVQIRIFNREGVELYDSRIDSRLPGMALKEAREAELRNPHVTRGLRDDWLSQKQWHEDVPRTLAGNRKLDSITYANLISQHDTEHATTELRRVGEQVVEMDHATRIRPARLHAGKALGVAGLALDAYDAADTVRTASRLRAEGNDTAAESTLVHFGARSVGGWAGAGLGMAAGAAAGVETGPGLLVTGAIGGVAGVFAGDKFAEWTDNRRIYNQRDAQGNTWTHDPDHPSAGWQRRAPVDSTHDGLDNPFPRMLRATPETANQLNYQATRTSVELVLGGPPQAHNPFIQPASASDPVSVPPAAWVRNADSRQWQREVMDFVEQGIVMSHVDIATPERAAQLERAAAQVLAQNAANSRPAIAARFEEAYARNGWAAYGPMPEAVTGARTDLDTLVASDGNRYQRQSTGEWVSEGTLYNSTAHGNLREELNITREVVRMTLPPPQPVQTPPALSPEARLRDTVTGAYVNAGLTLQPAQLDAAAAAVRTTWIVHGLDPATTALQVQRDADGRYAADSALASLRLQPDGRGYAIAAVTTTGDIQRAARALMPESGKAPSTTEAPVHLPEPRRPTHADPHAAIERIDPAVEQFLTALRTGNEAGMSAACRAMEASDFGQRFEQQARAAEHQRLDRVPGREHPLFVQALDHVERLGPDAAGCWDRREMEQMAGAIALTAQRCRMPAIDSVTPSHNGEQLTVMWENPRNPVLGIHASVNKAQALEQPLERSLQETLEVARQQQQRDLAQTEERNQQRARSL